MVNAARFDSAGIAAIGCGLWIANPVEPFVSESEDHCRHATGCQSHFALTIGAGCHMVEASSRV